MLGDPWPDGHVESFDFSKTSKKSSLLRKNIYVNP